MFPYVVAYGFRGQTGTTFVLPGKEVTIEGVDEVLPTLLAQCNGFNSAEKIVASVSVSMGHEVQEIEKLIKALFDHRILIDAPRYYELFHVVSANPMPFLKELREEDLARMLQEGQSPLISFPSTSHTALEQLLERRESVRKFNGEQLSLAELGRLAWAIYGKTGRSEQFPESSIGLGTVPSGGALYPLRLFILARENPSNWTIYSGGPDGLRVKNQVSTQQVVHAFMEDSTLEDAAAVYVLACDFQQTTQKYSNRGYRYAFLEAGHAAQNAYLWCAEQGLGGVEVGGFLDEELANLLLLSYPKQAPLTTLVVGRRKTS